MAARKAPGIRPRHSRQCATKEGRRCNCTPTYEAFVYLRREGKKIRKTFPTREAAKAWRHDALVAVRKGALRATKPITLRAAADDWIKGARQGSIRNRSGDRYKPSVVRNYETALRLRVLPKLGGHRLSELRRTDLQDFADHLTANGMDASTIRNTFMPLRALYRWHVARGDLAVNPTSGLELPAVRSTRERIVDAEEATKLVAALRPDDRALWATALYAGLRRGELMALRWSDVDLAEGVIRIERGWDAKEGAIEPKSMKGRRKVPIAVVLRDYLVEHRMEHPRRGLVFGSTAERPFTPSAVRRRADTAWKNRKPKLGPITLHEARHTFASLMIAAGVNAKALATYMGHSSVTTTFDLYGHLMPGNEEEAAGLLDAYLERARGATTNEAGQVEQTAEILAGA